MSVPIAYGECFCSLHTFLLAAFISPGGEKKGCFSELNRKKKKVPAVAFDCACALWAACCCCVPPLSLCALASAFPPCKGDAEKGHFDCSTLRPSFAENADAPLGETRMIVSV